MGKNKQATVEMWAAIADNCDEILDFLQTVAVKSPRVTAAPLSLREDKRTRVWFCRWVDINLAMPPNPVPQDHTGLTGFLTDVATRL